MNAPMKSEAEGMLFAVTIFSSEKDNRGKQKSYSWVDVLDLLSKRDVRDQKSGPAFSPMRLKPDTTRAKANVDSIRMAVADIDDGTTLADLQPRIAGYTWVAYSSHSHDPEDGIYKFRLTFPLSRPCTPDEWPEVWTGFNILLGGHCDAACKDASRLYFLPSCPQKTEEHAFVKHNGGNYLDPDWLKTLSVKPSSIAINRKRIELAVPPKQLPRPEETPENIAVVEAMLETIDPDPYPAGEGNRKTYLDVIWAVADTGWQCAYELARNWASRGDLFDLFVFDRDWKSFDPAGGIHYGTLVHYAREAGYGDDEVIDTEVAKVDRFKTSGDIKNGEAFAAMNRDELLFVHETSDVLKFDGNSGWVHAQPGEAVRAGKAVVAEIRSEAAERWKAAPDDPKTRRLMAHVERSSTEQKILAMINMSKSEPGMTVRLSALDADPMLLGVANGVLDLRKHQLMKPLPSLLVTKRCPIEYNPEATAPLWEAFIERATRGKPELAHFLQRLAGYILTGDVGEQCFTFLHGVGRNGKTTYAETLRWLLGDYAIVLPTSTLMISKRDASAATPDLMLLKGSRLAVASELEENARFAEAALKSLTGGDTLTARELYGKWASWTPTHKLLIVGNHRPVISGGDYGIWRRVRLVPFKETIADSECDPKLLEKLRREGSGILNWCLDGLRDWQRGGLMPPAEVMAAGAAYQADMDTIGQWMDDHTEAAPGELTPTAKLYCAYAKWARDAGWKNPMTRNSFGRRLDDRGIPIKKAGSGIKHAVGLSLNADGAIAASSVF